jgi:hypothetical protein
MPLNVPWFIFITLLAMCAVVGIAFAVPQIPFDEVVQDDGTTKRVIMSHGYTHEKYPTMHYGGPGAERHAVTLWVGWAFAIVNVLFYVGCLLLGVSRRGSSGPLKVPFIVGGIIFSGIFTALIFSYRGYMNEETHALFLSFPKPTAWMLIGVWWFPLYFMAVYYRHFDQWYFTREDQQRLDEIIANRQQAAAGDR